LAKRHGTVKVSEKQPVMDELHPSYDPPHQWRTPEESRYLKSSAWETTRKRIKKRDDYTCRYCHFRTDFYMTADHIDGDPNNHDDSNLQLLCSWCNSVKHAGLSTSVQGHMHLYVKTKLSQVEVLQQTRRLRGLGWDDAKILNELGLKKRAEFTMDYDHLKSTVGFLFDSGKPTSIGWLTVSRPDGTFLRDDENRKRSALPPSQARLA
jgi:5-methylcytosine-specific restriction endonuclease McrA